MAIREILLYPKKKKPLRKKSDPVSHVDQKVKQLITDLKDTLNAHDHDGLEAIEDHSRNLYLAANNPETA